MLIGIYILRREAQLAGCTNDAGSDRPPFELSIDRHHFWGRLGYVFFYNANFYLTNPLSILRLWEGGMSFHGALLGVGFALFLMARRHELPFLAVSDQGCHGYSDWAVSGAFVKFHQW